MKKVFFIEGLPGSGKTTYTKKLTEHFKNHDIEVESYNEGDLHPIDLAWCAIFDPDMYHVYLGKHHKYMDQIIEHSIQKDIGYVVAYTKVRVDDKDVSFYQDYEQYEIYKADDFNHFKETHLKLWREFILEEKVYIFECIFLQNHINELILKFNVSKDEMVEYFKELYDSIDGEKAIFYIKQNNIDDTLNRIIEERRSTNENYSDWIDLVAQYFEQTKYGKEMGFIGREGALKYFKYRQSLELEILKELENVTIFELDSDYDSVFEEMKKKTI